VKKAMAELDAEQREALLCLVDFGLAICSAALAVTFLYVLVDLAS
jgi:ABC-type nickel/cobalt efflux system permease component RcnA